MSTITNKILIDIESLFDLRQGALSFSYEQDHLLDFISSDTYNFRIFDHFPNVSKTYYKETLKSKNKHLIPKSMITYMFHVLKTRIDTIERHNAYQGESQQTELIINVYPFVFSASDLEQLKNLIFYKLKTDCLITMINEPVERFTPYYLKTSNFIAAYFYSFSEWAKHHTDNLSEKSRLETMLYFPALGEGDVDKELDKKLQELGFKDIFTYTTYLYSSTVTVNFLPVLFYTNLTTAMIYIDHFNVDLKKESFTSSEPVDSKVLDEIFKNLHQENSNGDSGSTV